MTTLPRGERNNNPLNIKRTNPVTPWQGIECAQVDPIFVNFKEMKWGVRAGARLLINYKDKYHVHTIRGIIAKWAPAGVDQNSTQSYIQSVADKCNKLPDDEVDLAKYEDLFPVIKAMIEYENGRIDVTDGQITAGLVLAGVEPAKKDYSKMKEVIIAQSSVAGSAVIGVATTVNNNISSYSPILQSIADKAPWLVAGVFVIGMVLMLWKRIEDRHLGIR